MNEILFADLFAGIGGFHFAIKQIFENAKPVLVCEIDKYAKLTYSRNHSFPVDQIHNIWHYTRSGDEGKAKLDEIPQFHVLLGGFPCQAFSNAGKKAGFADETRGTLFFDLAKILHAKKPKYVLLENVKALKTHNNGNTWDVIRETLLELGYLVPKQPLILSPHELNVTQQIRQRVFIPAVLASKTTRREFPQDFAKGITSDSKMSKLRLDLNPPQHTFLVDPKVVNAVKGWGEFVKNVKRPKNRTLPVIWLDYMNDQKADVTGKSEWEIKYIRDMKSVYFENKEWIDAWMERHAVNEWAKRERKLEWQAGPMQFEIEKTYLQLRQSGYRFKKMNYFPTLVAMVQTSLIFDKKVSAWRYLSLNEVRQLQSFPKEFQPTAPEHQTYKQFGNAVNVRVVAKILAELVKL